MAPNSSLRFNGNVAKATNLRSVFRHNPHPRLALLFSQIIFGTRRALPDAGIAQDESKIFRRKWDMFVFHTSAVKMRPGPTITEQIGELIHDAALDTDEIVFSAPGKPVQVRSLFVPNLREMRQLHIDDSPQLLPGANNGLSQSVLKIHIHIRKGARE